MSADQQAGANPCADYFFIDQHNVYSVMACEGAPDAFSIKSYIKKTELPIEARSNWGQ
jgi:hypothetical protein